MSKRQALQDVGEDIRLPDIFPKQRLLLRVLCFIKVVTAFPSSKSVAQTCPSSRICSPGFDSVSRVPNPYPAPPHSATSVYVWFTLRDHLSPLKGPHPFWTPER